MLIYAIDDEENALEYLVRKIKKAVPEAEICQFNDAFDAIEQSKEKPFDVAFMDIQMPEIDGISLAKEFKKINPKCNLIFVTGYSEYSLDAFSLDASAYLLKPVETQQIIHALENLRYPVMVNSGPSVTVQCFGNFEIFNNGVPIKFKYSKTKEVLAYLIDRNGAVCNNHEVIANLWEDDDDHMIYYRSLMKDIHDTFEKLGCGDIFVRERVGASIVPSKIRCDYYDFLAGKVEGINAFRGEYMLQYSWAEETAASLFSDGM